MKLRKRRIPVLLAATVVVVCGLAQPAGAAPVVAGQDGGDTDALISLVDADRATFGGISFDRATGTATIRYDKDTGERAASARLGTRRAGAWRVVLQPVEHSLAELDVVRQRVSTDPAWQAVAGKLVSTWYTDVRQNRVAVGVTELTPEVTQAATRVFGDMVRLHVAPRPTEDSRPDDAEPWRAGILLTYPAGTCSSGYVIRTTTTPTQRRLVSAGHCGPANTTVRNNGDSIGTVVTRVYTDGGRDFAFIGGSTYRAFMYTGGPNSNTGFAVTGTRLSGVGLSVCTNGATSGEHCSIEVTAIDVCAKFTSGQTTCLLDQAKSTDGTDPSVGGDSGGPVIAYNSGLKVVGSIVGSTTTNVFFHSYHHIVPSGWTVDTL
jgi:alpha-lytic protease prodomain-containing protein